MKGVKPRQTLILLVEDSDVQALETRAALESAGHAVTRTATAEDALATLNQTIPDLVIADFHLPRMDGAELTRQLKLNARTRSVPVLMLTSGGADASEREGLQSGADAYVEKSSDPAQLLLRVQALLRVSRTDHAHEGAAFRQATLTLLHSGRTYRLQLESALANDGYVVSTSEAPDTLIAEAAAARAGDCVIVNLLDVKFDGVEICRRLAETRERLPPSEVPFLIVGIGGRSDLGDATVRAGFAAGADDVVPSGSDTELLRLRLKALVRRLLLEEEARGLDAERLAAHAAAEQFRILVQGVTDYALIMLDPQGRVATWNAGAERIKGYAATEIIGQPFSVFYPDDARSANEPDRALEIARQHGRHETESLRVRKDGSPFWAHVILDAIYNTDGELQGYANITRDVTERRQTAEELQQAREALLQAQKMEAIGQLTGGIAHDFNNMLAGIIGGLHLVQRRLIKGRPDEAGPLIEAALTSANRAASLTARLLAFGRRQSLDIKPVNVNQVIPSMALLLERTVGENISINFTCEGDLWARTDVNQLESALLNLAINARDAMPEGGAFSVSTHVEQLARGAMEQIERAGEYVRISVRDTGHGMSAEVLGKVFDPFFTTKPAGQGTGLGLSMVYGFVRQSGGAIVIQSTEGAGTNVNIWLPHSEPATEEAQDAPTNIEPVRNASRILIVEDDPQVRMLVREVLSELGHNSVDAADADTALAILNSNDRIDLLISDVGLPGVDGRRLAELARQARPELKILFMTGYTAHAANRADLLEDGMDMITKPFSLELFASKVRDMTA